MAKKVITRAVLDIATDKWIEEESYQYEGQWAEAGSSPSWDQQSFAFYEDGTESGSTQIGTTNAETKIPATASGYTFHVRVLIQEDNGKAGTLTTPTWQYNRNSAGWVNITTTSSYIKAVDSTNLTDGGDTTQRLGSGTYITDNNYVCEDGTLPSLAYNGNEAEALLSCQLVYGDVSDGDEILVRVSGLNTWTNEADISVAKVIQPDDFSGATFPSTFWTEQNITGTNTTLTQEGYGTSDARAVFYNDSTGSYVAWDGSLTAPCIYQPCPSGAEFVYECKWDTLPSGNQEMGLFAWASNSSFVGIAVYSNEGTLSLYCTDLGAGGNWVDIDISATVSSAPLYLRLEYADPGGTPTFRFWYSANGSSWTQAGSDETRGGYTFTRIYAYSGNNSPSTAHTSKLDYFWDTRDTIDPEDPEAGTRRIFIV